MSSSRKSSSKNKVVYQEFGQSNPINTSENDLSELPPQQQNLKIQTTKSGRKGKIVTLIKGFQSTPETLTKLLKELKTKCGAGGTFKENIIEIQGDRTQQLQKILTEKGYKVRII